LGSTALLAVPITDPPKSPLLVPWNQVRVSEIGSGVDGPIVRFYIGHPRVGTVELRGGLAKAAQDRAQ